MRSYDHRTMLLSIFFILPPKLKNNFTNIFQVLLFLIGFIVAAEIWLCPIWYLLNGNSYFSKNNATITISSNQAWLLMSLINAKFVLWCTNLINDVKCEISDIRQLKAVSDIRQNFYNFCQILNLLSRWITLKVVGHNHPNKQGTHTSKW